MKQIQATASQYQATLVSYSITDYQLYIWVVTPQGQLTFRRVDLKMLNTSANQQGLTDYVLQLRNTMLARRSGNKAVTAATREGYKLLIAPIADLLPTSPQARVIFTPQASLFLVPFAALQDREGKYLIEKHTISLAPSIQALSLLEMRSLSTDTNALVVGNPNPLPVKLEPLPGAEA